jgi:hypothetical protein
MRSSVMALVIEEQIELLGVVTEALIALARALRCHPDWRCPAV